MTVFWAINCPSNKAAKVFRRAVKMAEVSGNFVELTLNGIVTNINPDYAFYLWHQYANIDFDMNQRVKGNPRPGPIHGYAVPRALKSELGLRRRRYKFAVKKVEKSDK